MGNTMMGAFGMLAGLVIYMAALLAAIRFLMQAAHVDAYNPLAQYVIRITNPVLSPMRTILPSGDRVDMASLVAVWLLQIGQLALIREPAVGLLLLGGLVQTIDLFANLYFFALIIVVVMSFVAPASGHPRRSITASIDRTIARTCAASYSTGGRIGLLGAGGVVCAHVHTWGTAPLARRTCRLMMRHQCRAKL